MFEDFAILSVGHVNFQSLSLRFISLKLTAILDLPLLLHRCLLKNFENVLRLELYYVRQLFSVQMEERSLQKAKECLLLYIPSNKFDKISYAVRCVYAWWYFALVQ